MSHPVSGPYQRLWLAVVQQALDDLTDEPWHSLDQAQAVCFFTSDGPWAVRRAEIAEHLGVHGDDLRRVGRERLAAREAREPAPARLEAAAPPRPVVPPAQRKPIVLPRLVAIPAPPKPQPERGGHKRWTHNPFDPFRPLPSEVRAADVARLEAAAQRRDAEIFDANARDAHAPHLQRIGGGTR